MEKIRLTAVVGPTASGKSSLALELAKRTGAHILSCDSMQIYRKMDIGTAKPTPDEMREVPHHMIDIVDHTDNFTLADFVQKAREEIEKIRLLGAPIIICGGTGLYLDTLLRGGELSPDIPSSVFEDFVAVGNDALYDELCAVDPASAEIIHKNNRRRVERALAVYRATGITKTEWDRRSREVESPYDAIIIGLNYRDREVLYDRINKRVDIMFDDGLEAEVASLGLDRKSTAGQAIGYKEVLSAFDGECTIDDAREQIKQATRNYAKRQLTWFRRNSRVDWFYPDEDADLVNNVLKLLTNRA
ncbi:MAG: tRNA (adenosine(37)-N6)-dimethylallyltransferase MiaA [Clostridia bacterium]|nr:tRNA (adenosine(37)-N6)-dimethylallyltransferase MiaA [Clostridia bacterium]